MSAYDNSVIADDFGVTTVTTGSFTLAGSDRAACLGLVVYSDISAETASCGGVSGTKIPNTDLYAGSMANVMLFSVIAPPAGSQTATASWTTAGNASLSAISMTTVHQTTPTNNGVTKSEASSTTISQAVTGTPDSLTVSLHCDADGSGLETSNQTKRTTGQGCMDTAATTGGVTHTWTRGSATLHIMTAANFVDISGIPPPRPSLNPLTGWM